MTSSQVSVAVSLGEAPAGEAPRRLSSFQGRREIWARRLLIAFFLIYVSVRVFSVALTNDEYGALRSVYQGSLADLVTFEVVDAQNHPLAAFLAILARRYLPVDEILAVRLPAVFGFLLFSLGALRVTARLEHAQFRVLGLGVLLANAFALDFFSLARGYGLALGFEMLSLSYLIDLVYQRSRPSYENPRAQLALWCGCLAVISHLAFLSYFVALSALLLFLGMKEQRVLLVDNGNQGDGEASDRLRPERWLMAALGELRRQGYVVVCAALLAVFYLPIVIKLTAGDKLYFGGTKGWVADSVRSLIEATFYRFDPPGSLVLGVAYGLTALGVVLGLRQLRRSQGWRSPERLQPAGLCFLVLLGMAVFAWGLHWVFDVRFVLERAALILLPPAICFFVFSSDNFTIRFRELASVLLIAYALLGVSQLNLQRTHSWEMTAEAPQWVEDLFAIQESRGGTPMVLGLSDSCKFTTYYYVHKLLSQDHEPVVGDKGLVRIADWLALYSVNLQPVGNFSIKLRTDSEAPSPDFQYWLAVAPLDEALQGTDTKDEPPKIWVHRDTDYLLVRDVHGLDRFAWAAEVVEYYEESRTALLRLR